jgi:PKD repeat protein
MERTHRPPHGGEKMKRFTVVLVLGLILAFALAAPALATGEEVTAAYEPGVPSQPGVPTEGGSLAQSFTAETTGVLVFADLNLGTLYNKPQVYVDLCKVSGAYGTDSVPTGDPIARSEPVTAHETGFARFTFAGTDALLTAGEQYALVLRTEADVTWFCSIDTVDDPYSGNMAFSTTPGVWSIVPEWAGADFYFRVWVGNPASEGVNHAPVIPEAGISAASSLVPVGSPVNMSAPFSDEDAGDSHTATWQWTQDDPSVTSSGSVSGTTVTGCHTYTAAGVYEVALRVVDGEGAVAVQSFRYVVVYDPAAGFVTGGGWIDSPAGALVSDPTLTGKASFGFVSKYQKGATLPSGTTQFQFQAGSLDFKSTSYDWLVIAGARAQYKGSGTINGQGDYGFMLTAVDGQAHGGAGADKFRIKIWDKDADGAIVYDNQIDAGDDAALATVLGGGSIVIHK